MGLERRPDLVLAIRSAIRCLVPPLTWLRSSAEPFHSPKNRALVEGLTLYEQGLGQHGVPMRLVDGPDATWFSVQTKVDDVQAAIEKWRAEKHEPGAYPVVVDTRPSGPALAGGDGVGP